MNRIVFLARWWWSGQNLVWGAVNVWYLGQRVDINPTTQHAHLERTKPCTVASMLSVSWRYDGSQRSCLHRAASPWDTTPVTLPSASYVISSIGRLSMYVPPYTALNLQSGNKNMHTGATRMVGPVNQSHSYKEMDHALYDSKQRKCGSPLWMRYEGLEKIRLNAHIPWTNRREDNVQSFPRHLTTY